MDKNTDSLKTKRLHQLIAGKITKTIYCCHPSKFSNALGGSICETQSAVAGQLSLPSLWGQ